MGLGRCFSTTAASIGIFFFFGFCVAEKAPYSFAKEATSAPQVEYYDYIVAGGGTAGCALAATLSAYAKVLVLERGGSPYDNPNVTHLTGFDMSLLDTSPNSAAQQFVSTDGVFNHRARILGGGSAINAGLYAHASDAYVQHAGWDPELVKESYEWVERKVVFRPQLQPWQAAVRDGLLAADVLPYRGFTYADLRGTKIGGTIFDENGYRHTAADLLQYANPTKITVYLHATVQKILLQRSQGQRPKACGVLFKDSAGAEHMAYLHDGPGNEVILSAGALGSPQLLMLSGIGPAQQLKAHGIDVVLDQPMVGLGMADNPLNPIIIPSLESIGKSLARIAGTSDVGGDIESASDFILNQAWIPIIHQYINENVPANKTPIGASEIHVGLIVAGVPGPFSTGHLELKNKDPNDNPRVTFNYFQDRRDLETCVQGMKIVRRVVESKPIKFYRYPYTSLQSLINLTLSIPVNERTSHPSAAYSLEQYCVDTVITFWHYHGGCQVNRVVDHDYKVIGVDALRVVDASTFNSSPGTNPQATIMMLGRYMGLKIVQERVHKL